MANDLLDLPSVSPSELLLSKLLSERQSSISMSVDGQPWELALGNGAPAKAPPLKLQLEVNQQPVTFFTGEAFIDQIMPADLSSSVLTSLPSDLVQAAMESKLHVVFQSLINATGIAIKFISLTSSDGQSPHADFTINIQVGGTRYPVFMESSPIIFELIKLLPVLHPVDQSSDIPVWAGLELGQAKLSKVEVEQLGTGDVVFFNYHVTGQQLIVRINPKLAFVGEAEGTKITIKSRMDTMEEDQFDDNEQVSLSDLELELLFEVGRQQFSAQEIQMLKPGHVFDLERPIEQPVNVRANGKLIAECQLVQVNNRLGARITRIVN
ncbi:type III secretion system cytoplasmic ring protein SctQ [Endozoicomonas ascidiicola]|uniref:type III secretion system cytoplasmic ring protein SctQ n=1 Tax=Endozoicomonas ascidiicola TaxID=1698521 RepID=UPI00082E325F|nr:type III secretion system cytoplasmic ring protein SctQ [Endozoicomonas ascidiicola]